LVPAGTSRSSSALPSCAGRPSRPAPVAAFIAWPTHELTVSGPAQTGPPETLATPRVAGARAAPLPALRELQRVNTVRSGGDDWAGPSARAADCFDVASRVPGPRLARWQERPFARRLRLPSACPPAPHVAVSCALPPNAVVLGDCAAAPAAPGLRA
jgi:hypothetical protein